MKLNVDPFTRSVCSMTRVALAAAVLSSAAGSTLPAQAPAAAAPAAANRALGTVKNVSGGTLTIATDAGATVMVTLAGTTRVQQLAPGSTDLKTAEASTADAIAVGDRVLVTGTPGDPGSLTANRVILMKSSAIAQRNQSSVADWTRRGSGGIVTAVDPVENTVTISSGSRKITIDTTKSTVFRRYAPGSVKFEDAKPGTLAEIHPGDQLRVRGDRSADGATITADEIVSGAFKNLSGTIVSINAAANSLVIKDLATKKNEAVTLGPESDLRSVPPEMAARFAAARSRTGAAGGRPVAASATGTGTANGAGVASGAPEAGARQPGAYGAGRAPGAGSGSGGYTSGAGRGGDLSQAIPRLPKATLAELKTGEALMIVASGSAGGPYTAITVLSGVEPLLTGPAGSEMTISPWTSTPGAGGEGGGATE